MPSELDLQFDAITAVITGPGGPLEATDAERGGRTAAKLPPTLPQMLDLFCGLHGETVAVICGEEQLTFRELGLAAHRAAGVLVARGVRPGDRVAIAMRNAPTWIVSYMAALKAGAIATLINGWWERDELAHALALTDPRLVIADAPRARRIADAGWAGEVVTLPVERPIGEAMAALGDGSGPVPQLSPGMDATILFTSGSTGDAKGAVSTHRAVTAATYNFAAAIGTVGAMLEKRRGGAPAPHPIRALIGIPFFHVTGAVPLMLLSFVIGRGMVLMPKWDAGEALRLIEKHRVTYFLGVPTMSLELAMHPDRASHDLSSLTDIAAGGAPRPVAHVERLRETMAPAQPGLGYGLTETNATGCTNFWENYVAKPASTGRAQPFVELAIVDGDRRPVRAGEVGEIAIRTLANVRGYWLNEEATAKAFDAAGWFYTGDLGRLDEDGYLFIVDRIKDIIIRGGENISAAEVESAIYQHPDIAEASVFALDCERLGEVPGAVIHLQPGRALDHGGLLAFLEGKIARFKMPAKLWLHDEPLPKLGTGKIDKVMLRARYRGQLDA